MPRCFILFFRKIKEYVLQCSDMARLPRVGEMVDISVLYTAMGALMLVISMSVFLYGAVKDYRAAAFAQPAPVIQKEADSQQNTLSINASAQIMTEQKTATPVNQGPVSSDTVKTTTGDLPRRVETPVLKSRHETPISPVTGKIIVPYGWREHPFYKDWRFHPGINIQADKGDQVRAALSGKVVGIYKDTAGITMKTAHEDGRTLIYSNMSDAFMKEGQSIHQGEVLGVVGENLIEPGIYLHFEIWEHDRSLDPQIWMN